MKARLLSLPIGGVQGALSSGAVPMLLPLPASDKLLLFTMTHRGSVLAHIAIPENMDVLLFWNIS